MADMDILHHGDQRMSLSAYWKKRSFLGVEERGKEYGVNWICMITSDCETLAGEP